MGALDFGNSYEDAIKMSDIPGQSGSPAVLPGVFSQLPGSCLIGVSHFPDSGPEVLRSSFPGPSSSSHLGRDVSGSAEPALVLCALGTEHLSSLSQNSTGASRK